MADNNTRMEVEVSAIVNQADAEKAGKDLNKYVLNSFKDGYIKVPAEVEVEFNKASKELKKAHSEFVSQWKKMNSMGFDSSDEDLKKLIKKYGIFVKQIKKDGREDAKQYQALKDSDFYTVVNIYDKKIRSLKKRIKQLSRLETDNEADRQYDKKVKTEGIFKETPPVKKRRPHKQKWQDVISDDKFTDQLHVGASRAKATTPGSPINLGVRSPSLSGPFMTKDSLRRTNLFGTYVGKNPWQNAMFSKRYMKDVLEEEDASLTSTFNEAFKNYQLKAKETPKEIAKEKSDLYSLYAAREFGGIEHNRDDASGEDLFALIKASIKEALEAGGTEWSAISKIIAMLAHRYQNTTLLGMTEGDHPQGEFVAHDVAVEISKTLLKELKNTYGGDKDKSQLLEIQRVAKELRSYERLQRHK